MPEDDLRQAGRESAPPSFDFDEEAIATLLDTFVETRTGTQSKRVSRPADPDDAGAHAAQRTVFHHVRRHQALPLVGDSSETRKRRITLLEALSKRAVGSVRARLLTSAAELREQIGDAPGALLRYEEALAADARDVIVLRALRRDAIRRQDWEAAAAALEKEAALELAAPDRAAALRLLATILLYKLHEPAAAEQAASRAAELRGDDLVAWVLIASARLARDEPRRAAEALTSAAKIWPVPSEEAVILSHASDLMEQAHAPAQAKELLQRVLELEPGSLAARLGLVRSARALGELQRAIDELLIAAATASEPVARALVRTAAAAMAATGNREAAMAMLHGATDAPSRWTLAEAAALADDLPRAIEALAARGADDTETICAIDHARRARLAAQTGDRRALAEALREAPGEPGLGPYLQSLDRLCPDPEEQRGRPRWRETVPRDHTGAAARMARADEAARTGDLNTFLGSLRQEHDGLPEPHRPGAFLGMAEAASGSAATERLAALLEAEEAIPANPLLHRALWLIDRDAERNASRWMAEAERAGGKRAAFAYLMASRTTTLQQTRDRACELALERDPETWPALWALEEASLSAEVRARAAREQARLAPQEAAGHRLRASLWTSEPAEAAADALAALERAAPDPLLVEHLAALPGRDTEATGDLLRLAADRLGEPSYLQRAAMAYRRAGLPARAARALREAETALAGDVLTRVQRADAELEASEFARLADSAMQRAKNAEDELEQLGALSAMAEVDRLARCDMQSARLSLQSIAEMRPDHLPTARALEWDALRERDAERIRSSTRRLTETLPPGCPERIARRRLTVELLKTDPDILQADVDRMLRTIDDPLDADPGLARLVLGAAYARNDAALCLRALGTLEGLLQDSLARDAFVLEEAKARQALQQTEIALEGLDGALHHPLALEEKARLLQAAKRWEEAASAFQQAAERARSRPRAASLWREAAVILEERLGDGARATDAWVAAAECDITYPDVYRRLASLYRNHGKNEELESLTQARIDAGADTPTLAALLLERAAQRRARSDLAGMIDALEQCLELDPQHFAALEQLVDAHRLAENWQGAAETLIRIARLKRSREEQAWAFGQLGEIYHEHLGDLERSEAALRRARELEPGHVGTLDRLASVLALEGKARESARLLEELVRRAGTIEQARDYRIRLALAVEHAGQAKQSERMLDALRAGHPTEPDVILALADFYERQGDSAAEAMHLNRAANDLRAAIEARPGDEASWTTLVRVLHRRHGPGPASCAASAAIALGHPASLFEGDVTAHHEALGEPRAPLPASVDAVVAPPALPPTLGRLFLLCEEAFDKILPFDSAAWRLRKPSAEHRTLLEEAGAVAEVLGISEPRLKVTYIAPVACIPISGDPPTLVVGGHLHEMTTPQERVFLFARALKIAAHHLAPALRARQGELDAALLALLQGHDGGRAHGPEGQAIQELRKKLLRAVPRRWRDEVEGLVLELRGHASFSTRSAAFAISQLGDRIALTLTGDVPSAVDALLKMAGHTVPKHDAGRVDAIRETPEAWAIIEFAISDAHFEARAQAGVDL
jgi:hypothetical protein